MLVDGPVEIGPLAADLHVGLVDAPDGRARPAPLPTQPFLDLGRVFLNPAVDRRMVNRDAALAHHLLEITIAHPVAAIPPDRPEHDLTLKVAPLEVRHGPLPSLALDPFLRRTMGFATEPREVQIRSLHPAATAARDVLLPLQIEVATIPSTRDSGRSRLAGEGVESGPNG